jgi:hypothetical protein
MIGQEGEGAKIRPGEAEKDALTTAKLVYDSVLRMEGFRLGGGSCRIRIYRGDGPGGAPVVICSELPDEAGEPAANVRLLAEHIAGGVVRRHFPGGLPNLPRPLIWIERYLTFEGDPPQFALVDFAFWRPRPAGLGTDGFALHGGSDDPPEWRGDAKLAGRAIEVNDPERIAEINGEGAPPGPSHLFRADIAELVVVRLGDPPDHIVIESWHAGRGVERSERR